MAADRASRLESTEWVRREAERLELGWCYWALGTEFGVLDADGAWNAERLAALLPDRVTPAAAELRRA